MTSSFLRPGILALLVGTNLLPAHAVLPTIPVPAAAATPAIGAAGFLQGGLGMLIVLGLIFLCAWLARRMGLQRMGGGQVVRVVSSTTVGPRERIVVVEVGTSCLVLGVTASQITTLHTLDAQDLPVASSLPPESSSRSPMGVFAQQLRQALRGQSRRSS